MSLCKKLTNERGMFRAMIKFFETGSETLQFHPLPHTHTLTHTHGNDTSSPNPSSSVCFYCSPAASRAKHFFRHCSFRHHCHARNLRAFSPQALLLIAQFSLLLTLAHVLNKKSPHLIRRFCHEWSIYVCKARPFKMRIWRKICQYV